MATYIGDGVTVGHQALIHASTIENGAFIGMSAVVMDRARVERHAMVAAGSLVTPGKTVTAGQLWGGRPARFMRDLSDAELADFAYQTGNYEKLARTYLDERAEREA